MEEFHQALEDAHRSIRIADHLISVTYPMVGDKKLFISILRNIFNAFKCCVDALVFYDEKRGSPLSVGGRASFEERLSLFSINLTARYNISPAFAKLINEIREILLEHRKSPVEFVRHNRVIICSESYKLRVLSEAQLKEYIRRARELMQTIARCVT
ncbi:hypothetical protein COT48_04990 [Candidatus Woesearchaeota archaeon CG08_land_8_20_14_0_20_47_9]|nr:MAG: hypothetical protein COT48_04990 [Candidatus Woesearchaeota archaeon CG08_land_8_20_14_0_20_47_9]HII29603.1 hypothetical protein [Candidatus Woesearchaeota archaeon]